MIFDRRTTGLGGGWLGACALLVGGLGCGRTPEGPRHVEDAHVAGDAHVASVAAPAATSRPPADLGSLARALHERGLHALGAIDSRAGNIIVSPVSLGLTLAAAGALRGDIEKELAYEPLVSTLASCSGPLSVAHVFVAPDDIPPPARDAAWRLAPGQHLGREERDTDGCARVYVPFRREATPSLRDLHDANEALPPNLSVAGKLLGRSKADLLLAFAHAAKSTVAFRSCSDPPVPPNTDMLSLSKGPDPPAQAVLARAAIAEDAVAMTVALPLFNVRAEASHGASRGDKGRPTSFVLVLPKRACDGALHFDEANLSRIRSVLAVRRERDVQLYLPLLATKSYRVASAAAPLDGLLASTTIHLYPAMAAAAPKPPPNVTTVRADRPFLYAVVDDETQIPLVMGRFETLEVQASPRESVLDPLR